MKSNNPGKIAFKTHSERTCIDLVGHSNRTVGSWAYTEKSTVPPESSGLARCPFLGQGKVRD